MPSALIAPYTAPTRMLLHNLLLWMEPALLLEPPQAASPGCAASLLEAKAVKLIKAESTGGNQQEAVQAELTGLLRQWEDWIAMQRGAGALESIKAGVAPRQPKPETVRSLMKQIKAPQPNAAPGSPPPRRPPELILHLAHIRGLLAQDMEGIYSQVDRGQKNLRQSLGLDLDQEGESDLAEVMPSDAPPLDYRFMEEEDMAPNLSAWARLLPPDQAQGAVLATQSGQAAAILGERLKAHTQNRRPQRSQAGASQFEPYYISWPPQAARLRMPDLGALEPGGLLVRLAELAKSGVLAKMRNGFAEVLEQAAGQPFSAQLAGELDDKCRPLADMAATNQPPTAAPAALGQVELSLLLLPGLDLAGALALMRDETPEIKPDACLPLITVELV